MYILRYPRIILLQTRPFVREGTKHQETRNCQAEKKSGHKDRLAN
jgi:hypothetical protein